MPAGSRVSDVESEPFQESARSPLSSFKDIADIGCGVENNLLMTGQMDVQTHDGGMLLVQLQTEYAPHSFASSQQSASDVRVDFVNRYRCVIRTFEAVLVNIFETSARSMRHNDAGL